MLWVWSSINNPKILAKNYCNSIKFYIFAENNEETGFLQILIYIGI